MVDQQFFKDLEEHLKFLSKIRKTSGLSFTGKRHSHVHMESFPAHGILSDEERTEISKAVKYINERKKDFNKKGSYFYDKYVLPAARKLDEDEFTVKGKRIIDVLENGDIELKGSLFGKYADIDPRRISTWKSGAENISPENMRKLVIALKMDYETAKEFLKEGGFPFDIMNDDQDAIIEFTIIYAERHKLDYSVEDYMQILKEGHKYGNYKGIYDKLRYKTYYNKEYGPESEYTREVTVEIRSDLSKRCKKPDTEDLKLSGRELNQMLIDNYIQVFINKKNAEGDKIDKKLACYKVPLDLKKNFSEYAIIGPTAWENILYGSIKPQRPTMIKLAIAMEMYEDDARTFLEEAGERLKITEPLDFVVICAMEYEQKHNYPFSPVGFWNILERCQSDHEFNYKIPYHEYS